MNKSDLVTAVSAKTGLTKKDSTSAVNAITDTISEALTDGATVRLMGFGTFNVKEREVRMGRNPKTKEPITIPSTKAPIFKASKMLKKRIT